MSEIISNTSNEFEAQSYADFNLPETLLSGLKDLGYTKPTLVQQKSFALINQGKDIVIQSHTGSGKTSAFCLPLLTQIDTDLKSTQAVILVPTRELAKQVALECSRLAYHHKVSVAAIYGGASMEAQISSLKAGAQIVVATPGRVKDLLLKKFFTTANIKVAVLDEADEMLSMGFWDDVVFLLKQMPETKQTLFFSATVPAVIENAIASLLKDPISLNLSTDHLTAKTIHHIVHIEDETEPKQRNLLYALEFHNPKHAIIFCNTKDETELLENYLKRFGFKVKALNGDMSQSAREKVMHDIKEKKLDMVVATDIAARGIDINGLTHVFNYELPDNDEVYVHRTGRTGRTGALGTAISLTRGKNATQIFQLKEKFEIDIEEVTLPPVSEILRIQAERLATLLTEEADQVEFSQYQPVAKSMLNRPDIGEILGFLLRSFYQKQSATSASSFKPNSNRPISKPHTAKKPNPFLPAKSTRDTKELSEENNSPALDLTPKPPEKVIETTVADSEFTKLYITLGRDDGFTDLTELMQHISDLAKIDIGHFTGSGQVRDTSSHVEVDTEVHQQIIKSINGLVKNDKTTSTITCEITKPFKPKFKFPAKNRQRPF